MEDERGLHDELVDQDCDTTHICVEFLRVVYFIDVVPVVMHTPRNCVNTLLG